METCKDMDSAMTLQEEYRQWLKWLKVGDMVVMVHGGALKYKGISTECSHCSIVKIGKRWAYLSNGNRASIDDGVIDAGEYPSRHVIWPSMDIWHDYHRLMRLSITNHKHLTRSQLERIEAIINEK